MPEATDARGPEAKVDNSRLIEALDKKLQLSKKSGAPLLYVVPQGVLVDKMEGKDNQDIGEAKGLREAWRIRFTSYGNPEENVEKGKNFISRWLSNGQSNVVVVYEDTSAKLVRYEEEKTFLGKGEYDMKVRRNISPLSQKLSDALANVVEEPGLVSP